MLFRRILRRIGSTERSRGAFANTAPINEQSSYQVEDGTAWYPPILLNPATVAGCATDASTVSQILALFERLESDDYIDYLKGYYSTGLSRYGDRWRYGDILTVLHAASTLIQPKTYLEIGVRRGRSAAVVASVSPDCQIVGFDLWIQDYAGMSNPGPDFVCAELGNIGHRGEVTLIAGNSRTTVPDYFKANPTHYFDLITVDGDHSKAGARIDLANVIPRLRRGGIIVFDDIAHPSFPHLGDLWREMLARYPYLNGWEYAELGYGVAFAVRM